MKNQPKIVYNDGLTTLTLLFAQGPWEPRMLSVGGQGKSGAGVAETYVQRREDTLAVKLKFYETEWNAVASWIGWCHDFSVPFDFYPDKDLATKYTVYLESPSVNDKVTPQRSQYTRQFELDIEIRTANGARFVTSYI